MRFLFLTLLFFLCGCVSNPWAYNSTPGSGWTGEEAQLKPTIFLGDFTTSSGVDPRWSDVSTEMQKTFARALIKSGKFDVVHDRSSAERSTAGFFVEVKVTDFLHSSDAPESVRRLSWFTEANDAIVALDVTASNIHTSKIVFCDQVVATVLAGDKDTDQYGDLEFGSYLFWSTPLGKATTEAINDTVTKLATLRGSTPGTVTITKYVEGEREVTLSDRDILDDGGIYYVGTSDPVSHEFVSVDDDLGRPLRVKVEHHFFGNSTGWLLSEPAEYENIFGATLSKSPLPTQITSE